MLTIPNSHAETRRGLDAIGAAARRAWIRADQLGNREECAKIEAREAEARRVHVLRDLPEEIRRRVAVIYERDRFEAEALADALRDAARVLPLDAGGSEVEEYAKRQAQRFAEMIALGIDAEALRKLALGRGAALPQAGKRGVTDASNAARLQDPKFWRRQVWATHFRGVEHARMRVGIIGKRAEPYVSDAALQLFRARQASAKRALEGAMAVSDSGEEVALSDMAEAGMANKANRRAELMVRIRGMEEIARGVGHVGLFLTMTCPSRFHPTRADGREQNPKWIEAGAPTPRDAQRYLVRVYAHARSELDRLEIRAYGLRVAEAHADGCPHWHGLFFVPEAQAESFLAVMRKHFCADAPEEIAHDTSIRFAAVRIDWARGSAAGYVAKYVAKNIDGHGTGGALAERDDETGQTFAGTAERVAAWASMWGIRQFQAEGGPPVGLWRELRRLEAVEVGGVATYSRHAQIDAAAAAADRGDWAEFCRLTGGMACARKDRPIKLVKDPQEGHTNRYGEACGERVVGVGVASGIWWEKTRLERWRIEWRRGATASRAEVGRENRGPWTRGNNCPGSEGGKDGSNRWGENTERATARAMDAARNRRRSAGGAGRGESSAVRGRARAARGTAGLAY
jgi:hypothetical protein